MVMHQASGNLAARPWICKYSSMAKNVIPSAQVHRPTIACIHHAHSQGVADSLTCVTRLIACAGGCVKMPVGQTAGGSRALDWYLDTLPHDLTPLAPAVSVEARVTVDTRLGGLGQIPAGQKDIRQTPTQLINHQSIHKPIPLFDNTRLLCVNLLTTGNASSLSKLSGLAINQA